LSGPPVLLGTTLPDVAVWSPRVTVALGQNPSLFTGPGTNTYLLGTGRKRILLDTGQGVPAYLPVLARALERADCAIQEIVLTHGHPDHIGGAAHVIAQYGPLRVSKRPHAGFDAAFPGAIEPIDDGDVVRADGATLRALHTPGHAEDHLCFVLEEENAIFSGDNVLGVGTTVIPAQGGDLLDYLNSLERLLAEAPGAIYPAHGPVIRDGRAKLREYIDHRMEREREILDAMRGGLTLISDIVARVYAAYPVALHGPAKSSVCSHLQKLEREGRVRRNSGPPLDAAWSLV
jgi:glyoxylase-like metal-dependent hydrolase (beta-lactamase superfamily II)